MILYCETYTTESINWMVHKLRIWSSAKITITMEHFNILKNNHHYYLTALSQCNYCPCGANCYNMTAINLCLYVPQEEATWFNGRQHCVDRGGDLLVLDSEQLHKEVSDGLVKNEPELQNGPVFIGLYKDNFYWDDSMVLLINTCQLNGTNFIFIDVTGLIVKIFTYASDFHNGQMFNF